MNAKTKRRLVCALLLAVGIVDSKLGGRFVVPMILCFVAAGIILFQEGYLFGTEWRNKK